MKTFPSSNWVREGISCALQLNQGGTLAFRLPRNHPSLQQKPRLRAPDCIWLRVLWKTWGGGLVSFPVEALRRPPPAPRLPSPPVNPQVGSFIPPAEAGSFESPKSFSQRQISSVYLKFDCPAPQREEKATKAC